jgi:hypothetical protein
MDTPQPETPDLDAALHELRQAFADVGVVTGIVTDLRRNAARLLPLLADELRRLRTTIDRTLPLISDR